MSFNNFFLLTFVCTFMISIGEAKLTPEEEKHYDELESLPLIQSLYKDLHYEEAVLEGSKLSLKGKEKDELHYLMASSYYHLKDYPKAFSQVKKLSFGALKESKERLLHGKIQLGLKDKNCKEIFAQIPLKDFKNSDWPYFFDCLELTADPQERIELSLKSFDDHFEFFLRSQQILYQYSLSHEAQTRQAQNKIRCFSVEEWQRFWRALEGLHVGDITLLEKAHACHPSSPEVTSLLIKALFNEGKFHSIAYLFEQESRQNSDYLKHTAEFYQVAKRENVSQYYFMLSDPETNLLSKATASLDQGHYLRFMSLPFSEKLLTEKRDLAYAMAYSHFQVLEVEKAKSLLSRGVLNENEKKLSEFLEECRRLDWRCRP